MDRRTFLAAAASSFVLPAMSRSRDSDKLRVAAIGHTGRGDFRRGKTNCR